MTIDIALKFIWPAIWQSAMLAVVVGGVTLLLRERLEPRWRYLLWGIVLLRLALPVLPSSPVGLLPTQHQPQTAAVVDAPSPNTATPHVANHALPKPPPLELQPISIHETTTEPTITQTSTTASVPDASIASMSLRERITWAFFSLWLCGVVFFAFKYASGEIWLQRLCRRVRPSNDFLLNTMLHECRREFRIRRRVRLYVVPQEIAAASFGVIFPTIILSERVVRQFSPDALRLVLLHELAHIKRLDPAVHVFVRLVSIFHWPNPVLWLTRWRLECEREHACDAAVLHKLERKKHREYGQMVLTFADWCAAKRHAPTRQSSALVGVFPNHDLKRRITMIIKHKPSRWWQPLLGATLITTLALAGLTTAKPAPEENQKLETLATPDVPIIQVIAEKTPDIPDGNVQIRGTVVDADDKPVSNAKVYFQYDLLADFGESPTITNQEGEFVFLTQKTNLKNMQIIAVSQDETRMAWTSIPEISKDQQVVEIRIWLREARTITGTVTDAKGKPIEGAYVGGSSDAHMPMFTQTDSSGNFRFPFIGVGVDGPLFQVYAIKPGVGVAWVNTEEQPTWEGKTPPEKISNGPFHLTIQDKQIVQVLVTDENGTPLPDCQLLPSVQIGEDIPKMYYYSFRPSPQFSPPACIAKTDRNGLATFDWVPKKDLLRFVVTAHAPDTPITLPDGSKRYFGESAYTYWNKKDEPMVVKLPQMAKVKGKVLKPDGTPAPQQYTFFANWKSQTRPAGGQAIRTDRLGEFEITGNVHDIFDAHSIGWSQEKMVFPTVKAFDMGDGTDVKELNLTLQPGIKIWGTVFDQNGQPMQWQEKYHLTGYDISPDLGGNKERANGFMVSEAKNYADEEYYEVFLAPGTYEFKIELDGKYRKDAKPEDWLGDTQTVTVTEGQKEVRLDLHLKPVPKEE